MYLGNIVKKRALANIIIITLFIMNICTVLYCFCHNEEEQFYKRLERGIQNTCIIEIKGENSSIGTGICINEGQIFYWLSSIPHCCK